MALVDACWHAFIARAFDRLMSVHMQSLQQSRLCLTMAAALWVAPGQQVGAAVTGGHEERATL
jgi:hypothetical protein